MKKLILVLAIVAAFIGQSCRLNTVGEGDLFGEGKPSADSGVEAAAGSPGDVSVEPAPEVGTGGFSGTSGASGAAGEGGTAGIGGASGTGGMGGSSGSGGSAGQGGASGGSSGAAGNGGIIADAGDEDVPDAADVIAEEASSDVAEETETDAEICPNGGILDNGPADCGTVPSTGLAICIVLAHDATCGFVGAAGGNPPQGQPVDPYFNDPMIVVGGPCVASAGNQNFVLCQSPAPSSTLVQFAPGLHSPGNGPTIPGRFACDNQACRGKVFIYKDGSVVGSLQNGTTSGILNLVPHQGRLDLSFISP